MSTTINAAWHERHPMPRGATTEQRIAWHLEHQKECRCRPIPAKLLEQMAQAAAPAPAAARDGTRRGRRSRRDDTPTRYALLLRGVNVGTKNSLPMADLRAMLAKIGCTDVQTYVQSGNAVFGTTLGAAELTSAIEEALARAMGRPIATTLRTDAQMRAIVEANPLAQVATNPANLCVTFLSRAPTAPDIAPLHAQDFAPERFQVSGDEIYTWHPNGQGKSPLAAALGKLPLRGAVTTRNWNTVLKLVELLGASPP
jgi:uncharacterized protein (DUF1697 family)